MLNGVLEDATRFLQPPGKDSRQAQAWLEGLNYREVLPLVAVDLAAHRFVGVALLTRDRLGAGGRVHLFSGEPFRRLGLPRLLLAEILDLAARENLRWLRAEVSADDRLAVQAFRDQGFEIRATLEDLFRSEDGSSRPVLRLARPVGGKTTG
jgi:GNAT superfamily N-acetyltransferase